MAKVNRRAFIPIGRYILFLFKKTAYLHGCILTRLAFEPLVSRTHYPYVANDSERRKD